MQCTGVYSPENKAATTVSIVHVKGLKVNEFIENKVLRFQLSKNKAEDCVQYTTIKIIAHEDICKGIEWAKCN